MRPDLEDLKAAETDAAVARVEAYQKMLRKASQAIGEGRDRGASNESIARTVLTDALATYREKVAGLERELSELKAEAGWVVGPFSTAAQLLIMEPGVSIAVCEDDGTILVDDDDFRAARTFLDKLENGRG